VKKPLAEALIVFALSVVGILLALLLGRGPLREYRAGIVGAIYLLLPVYFCRLRGLDPERYAPLGFPKPLLSLGLALLFAALTFPPFVYAGAALGLSPWPSHFALPKDFILVVLTQLLVVAVPEELFFRGFLQPRLDDAFGGRLRLFGVEVGWGLPAAALLFAASHYVSIPSPGRLATFLPGLAFGFLRAATGGVWSGALYHGLCNIYLEVLISSR
jgi:membrane protease YdiL (CAAX protease family)